MNLGEKIYALRTAKNLSQGDVADALDVSRQSVSKWENNSAIPDLEKIIKLAELFGVSLDELVLDKKVSEASENRAENKSQQSGGLEGEAEKQESSTAAPQAQPRIIIQKESVSSRKIAGIVLLCMAFLVLLVCTLLAGGDGFLAGILFSIPFVACGIICFTVKRHTGLWCVWAVYICVDSYLRWATGINWKLVLWTPYFEASMNYMRLAMAWVEVAAMLALLGYTVYTLAKEPVQITKKQVLLFVGGAVILLALGSFIGTFFIYRWTLLLSAVLDWAILAAVVAAGVAVIRYRKERSAKE